MTKPDKLREAVEAAARECTSGPAWAVRSIEVLADIIEAAVRPVFESQAQTMADNAETACRAAYKKGLRDAQK